MVEKTFSKPFYQVLLTFKAFENALKCSLVQLKYFKSVVNLIANTLEKFFGGEMSRLTNQHV